jgi:hypothetical protein
MKTLFSTLLLTLAFGSQAMALDPAINCLQWKLSTERAYVSKDQAANSAKQTLANLKKFGFKLETAEKTPTHRSYFFRYNRDQVLSKQQTLRDFEAAIFQHSRNVNSQLGYLFECSFSAPTPWPRVSGSSVR